MAACLFSSSHSCWGPFLQWIDDAGPGGHPVDLGFSGGLFSLPSSCWSVRLHPSFPSAALSSFSLSLCIFLSLALALYLPHSAAPLSLKKRAGWMNSLNMRFWQESGICYCSSEGPAGTCVHSDHPHHCLSAGPIFFPWNRSSHEPSVSPAAWHLAPAPGILGQGMGREGPEV